MPANMMTAEVMSIRNVIGSNSDSVAAGPRPGSTPMAVPITTPTRQYMTLSGESEIWNPSARFAKKSTVTASRQPAAGKGHVQKSLEQEVAQNQRPERHRQRQSPAQALDEPQDTHEDGQRRYHVPGHAEQRSVDDQRGDVAQQLS